MKYTIHIMALVLAFGAVGLVKAGETSESKKAAVEKIHISFCGS